AHGFLYFCVSSPQLQILERRGRKRIACKDENRSIKAVTLVAIQDFNYARICQLFFHYGHPFIHSEIISISCHNPHFLSNQNEGRERNVDRTREVCWQSVLSNHRLSKRVFTYILFVHR